ncbi:hypothetical protein AQUCO_04200181v1 [Aquilegia coerulea]|uniref:MAT1 centre domain-containing protein n=1 Tax=Aquilegia coerulea TaxID=218851 RepID=A0A2G5CPM1_AQUCA|nr:hypothetical protein AQUCO_04200181v1 [Aquilegia coerulea]PIA33244.1 hypothetical protein AQUCO_04200181v1 [Aquilegia coerulea]
MVVVSGTNSYAKEMAIRKRISNIFNKREDDFPSLRDYNDYLEEVEDMTFNLIEGIDVATIEAKIAKYQAENAEQIINARARKAEELASALAASKGVPMQPDAIDGAATQSSEVGESVGGQMQYAPAVTGIAYGQPRPTGMAPQPVPLAGGPDMQAFAAGDEEMLKLRAERGAKAGGWSLELSKRRSIEEAFDSMWF